MRRRRAERSVSLEMISAASAAELRGSLTTSTRRWNTLGRVPKRMSSRSTDSSVTGRGAGSGRAGQGASPGAGGHGAGMAARRMAQWRSSAATCGLAGSCRAKWARVRSMASSKRAATVGGMSSPPSSSPMTAASVTPHILRMRNSRRPLPSRMSSATRMPGFRSVMLMRVMRLRAGLRAWPDGLAASVAVRLAACAAAGWPDVFRPVPPGPVGGRRRERAPGATRTRSIVQEMTGRMQQHCPAPPPSPPVGRRGGLASPSGRVLVGTCPYRDGMGDRTGARQGGDRLVPSRRPATLRFTPVRLRPARGPHPPLFSGPPPGPNSPRSKETE